MWEDEEMQRERQHECRSRDHKVHTDVVMVKISTKTPKSSQAVIVFSNFFFFCYLTMFLVWNSDEREKNKQKGKSRQEFASAGLKILIVDGSASEN